MPRIGPQIVVLFDEAGEVVGVYTAKMRTRVALVYRTNEGGYEGHTVGHFLAVRSIRTMPPKDAEFFEEQRARPRRGWLARKGNLRRRQWPRGRPRRWADVLAALQPDGQQLPTEMSWREMLQAEPEFATLRRDVL